MNFLREKNPHHLAQCSYSFLLIKQRTKEATYSLFADLEKPAGWVFLVSFLLIIQLQDDSTPYTASAVKSFHKKLVHRKKKQLLFS